MSLCQEETAGCLRLLCGGGNERVEEVGSGEAPSGEVGGSGSMKLCWSNTGTCLPERFISPMATEHRSKNKNSMLY